MDNGSGLLGHFKDLLERSSRWGCVLSSSFLAPDELEAAKAHCSPSRVLFYGGYQEAERQLALFLPEENDPLEDPASFLVCLHYRVSGSAFGENLSHREALGAILGCGLERDSIGDVLVEKGDAYCFCLPSVSEELLGLSQMGPHKVHVERISPSNMPLRPKLEIKRGTVASLRLDAILSEVFHLSRSEAQEAIAGGSVRFGSQVLLHNDFEVQEGMALSCKGKGKFVYQGEKGSSRKGKILIEYGIYR